MKIVKSFRDLGIKSDIPGFVGDKIAISKILNREIQVLDFKITDSKYSGKCLYLQIEYKEEKRVIFTGSRFLREVIEKIPKSEFPFKTTIIEEDERYEFS